MGSSMRGHPGKRYLTIAVGARALHLLVKALEIGAAKWLPLDLRIAQWIDRLAAAQNLEVQMRTGRATGVADEADHFALAYLYALLDARREFGKVAIDRGELPRMIDADPVAIAAICRCADNDAVGRSVYRRAGRRREIDALMHEHRGKPPRRRLHARRGRPPHGNAEGRGSVDRRPLAAHTAGRLVGAAHRRAPADRLGRWRRGARIQRRTEVAGA